MAGGAILRAAVAPEAPLTPSPAPLLQLVFRGECLDGHDPDEVRRAVTAALGLEGRRAQRLFSGRRIVVSRGLDMATAHRRIARFAMMGAVLHAEPMAASAGASAAARAPAGVAGVADVAEPRAPADRPTPQAPKTTATAVATPSRRARAAPSRLRGIGGVILMSAIGALLLGLVLGPGLDALTAPRAAAPSTAAAALHGEATATTDPGPAAAAAGQRNATGATDATTTTAGEARDPLPKEMSADARRDYKAVYPAVAPHKAFAISGGGGHGWFGGATTPAEAREIALARCANTRRGPEDACRVIDADGRLEE